MSYFYSHLVEIEIVTAKLNELDMTPEQKKHLAALIDATIHQEVLDVIFCKLPDEDKILFIEHFAKDPENPEIMNLLNKKITDIEKEIRQTAQKITKELHDDIETAKKGGI